MSFDINTTQKVELTEDYMKGTFHSINPFLPSTGKLKRSMIPVWDILLWGKAALPLVVEKHNV